MHVLFSDFDIAQENEILEKNNTLSNLVYLNELHDLLNTLEIRFSNILEKNIKIFQPRKRFIKGKEKYYNKKLVLDEKLKSLNLDTDLETPFEFINNFDKVDKNKIYKYFKDNLVLKGYLSEIDLERYLITAFQNKTLLSEKLSFKKNNIGKITNIFYKYYYELASKPHGEKTKYAELLGNYFVGFETKKVKNNFAKNF